MENQGSDVRRLLTQIDAEYEAAERGLYGLAYGTPRHDFLTARTERIAGLHAELGEMLGDKEYAMQLIAHHQQHPKGTETRA